MKEEYVLVMKVTKLTWKQAAELEVAAAKAARRIAPSGSRTRFIEKREGGGKR